MQKSSRAHPCSSRNPGHCICILEHFIGHTGGHSIPFSFRPFVQIPGVGQPNKSFGPSQSFSEGSQCGWHKGGHGKP